MPLQEKLYIRTDSQMMLDFPERIIASTRFFENGKIIPHEDNDKRVCETDIKYEGREVVLVGKREFGNPVEILREPRTAEVPEISNAAKRWIENQAKRMSRKYGIPIVYSPIYPK